MRTFLVLLNIGCAVLNFTIFFTYTSHPILSLCVGLFNLYVAAYIAND